MEDEPAQAVAQQGGPPPRRRLSAQDLAALHSSLSDQQLHTLLRRTSQELERRALARPRAPVPLSRLAQDALKLAGNNFLLAFNLRAGVAVLLRVFKLLKQRPKSLASVQTLLGENTLQYRVEAVRLGCFAGALSGGFTFLREAIRRQFDVSEETGTWLAGVLASLAVFFVPKDSRRTISLYLFARVAQSVYNSSKARGWFHFWGSSWAHGDSLLFIVTSAVIMYAYAMVPESLPRNYWQFIVNTGPVRHVALEQVRRNNRGLPVQTEIVREFVTKYGGKFDEALAGPKVPPLIPCSVLHPHNELCSKQIVETFAHAMAKTLPIYLTLSLVPPMVFSFKRFMATPGPSLVRAVLGATRSSVFLSTFPTIFMGVVCTHRNLFASLGDHKSLYLLAGALASTTILIEKKSRRAELALYALPRASDALYYMMKRRQWLVGVPRGEELLFALSMGSLLYFHHHERATVTPLFAKLIDVFLPPASQKRPGVGADGDEDVVDEEDDEDEEEEGDEEEGGEGNEGR